MKTLRLLIVLTISAFSLSARASRSVNPPSKSSDEHFISGLLQKYHLETKPSPFSLVHQTEIYNSFLGSMAIPKATEDLVRQLHSHLNNSMYYRDTKILGNPEKVRKYQLKQIRGVKSSGQLVDAQTSDGHTIHGTLLNRGSKKLLVCGGGFTNAREVGAPLGDLFDSYDVLFFDYRGHGSQTSHPLRPRTWKSLSKRLLGIDRKHVSLGAHEDRDVHAIVSKVKSMKKYDQVIGLGLCYSGLIFTKTAALHPDLFDKLILNGCWFSLQHAVEILARDPGLLARPQVHSRLARNWLVRQRWFQRGVLAFAQRFFDVEFATVSILDYAPSLKEDLEVLFLHGKDDVLIPMDYFEILWHATPCRKKTAIITSNEHIWDHLRQKEFYKEAVERFIDNSYEQFSHLLVNPEALVDYKAAQLQQKL